jgi:hypothetical protein
VSVKKRTNRGLINRKAISTSVENELYKQFVDLSTRLRVVKSTLLDEAITDLLNKYNVKSTGGKA